MFNDRFGNEGDLKLSHDGSPYMSYTKSQPVRHVAPRYLQVWVVEGQD